MRCFKRNFGEIGSDGPYFCGFRLRVLISTIKELIPVNSVGNSVGTLPWRKGG